MLMLTNDGTCLDGTVTFVTADEASEDVIVAAIDGAEIVKV